MKISINELSSLFRYEPNTGALYWRVAPSRGVFAGDQAGSLRKDGYVRLQLRGDKYLCHVVAWALQTGSWPSAEIDHLDGVGANNVWSNLREADRSSNMMNQRHARVSNPTGLLGATRHREAFTATIITRGTRHYLGRFSTAEQAHAAYMEAKRQQHPTCTI